MNSQELKDFKQKFYRSGNLYFDISDKRHEYTDNQKKIICKYKKRIKSINSLLESLLDVLSTDDVKKMSLFLHPFENEEELDSNYAELIPWDSCIDFLKNFDEVASKENNEQNFKQFYSTVIRHYDLYKDFIRTKYEEFKNFMAEPSSLNSNLSFSSAEIDTSLSIGLKNLGAGKIEIMFPNIDLIKDVDFEQLDLSFMFNEDDVSEQYSSDNAKWIGAHFFELLFNTAFEKKAFLIYTLCVLESKLIEDEKISYFYKARELGFWFIQDRLGMLYKLKMYSNVVSFFDKCNGLISPYSILSNDPTTLVWVAYYFDSLLKLHPENKNLIKKGIIKYYRRIYRIMLFIQSGMEFNDYVKNSVDYEVEITKLLPNDVRSIADSIEKSIENDLTNRSLKTINNKTIASDEVNSVLRKITSMFPDIFDEGTIETFNEIEEEFLSRDKLIKEQDDKIKKLEQAYYALNNEFAELKDNRESLSEEEFNEGIYQLIDDMPSEEGKDAFEEISINNIPSNVWSAFSKTTKQSIKAAFTLVNHANLPIDLAVLSILRCIEIEFVEKFANKFNNQFYKTKSLEFFKENSPEGNVHISLVHAIKNGSFSLGEMENLGEFLSDQSIENIKSPLVRNFKIFLGDDSEEFCNICSHIKACNEKGESSKNCSHKFLNDYEAVSIRELRNKIAHGDKKITKIDRITFKRIYLAMVMDPLKILVHMILLSEHIESMNKQ